MLFTVMAFAFTCSVATLAQTPQWELHVAAAGGIGVARVGPSQLRILVRMTGVSLGADVVVEASP